MSNNCVRAVGLIMHSVHRPVEKCLVLFAKSNVPAEEKGVRGRHSPPQALERPQAFFANLYS